MAIIADIVHRGVVYPDIYISPHSINSDSFYTLKYLVGGKGGPPLLGMEETMRSFTFNNSRAGLLAPDGAGIAYDRDVGAWPQVYADLKAKSAAGACSWITNIRDEWETPSLDALTDQALEDRPDLFSNTEAVDPEKEALRARIAELESRPPEIRTVEVEKIVERVVEVPVAAVVEAPTDGIPAEFRGLKLVEESPEKFTERMKRRWQALQHLRIDGSKPTNARALPDMTEEEIAELVDLEERNKTTRWLD